jgi:hypothetical protein
MQKYLWEAVRDGGGELAELELREKSLSKEDMAVLRGALEEPGGQCARLAFHSCNLAVFQDGIVELCTGLAACARLRELTLVHCFIDAVGARALGGALAHTSSLTLLRVEQCGLSSFSTAELCVGLASCPRLQDLSLAHNSVGLAGAQALETMLASKPLLRALDAKNSFLTASGTRCLAKGLSSCPLLQDLILAHNPIGDAGVAELAACALFRGGITGGAGAGSAGRAQLVSLNVEQCGLTEQGVRDLCGALLPMCEHTLSDLNVSSNQVSDRAAEAIARLLARSTRMRKLVLASCQGLSPRGIALICQGLEACKYNDLELRLEHNAFGDAGALALAALDLGALKLLNIRNCGIRNLGRLALAQTLRASPPPDSRAFKLIGISLSRVWQQLEPPATSDEHATHLTTPAPHANNWPSAARTCAEGLNRDAHRGATACLRCKQVVSEDSEGGRRAAARRGGREEGEGRARGRERRMPRSSNSLILHYWRQRVERDLAFCMLVHWRLGSGSMWSGLDKLLVQALLTSFQTHAYEEPHDLLAGENDEDWNRIFEDEDEDEGEGDGEKQEELEAIGVGDRQGRREDNLVESGQVCQ